MIETWNKFYLYSFKDALDVNIVMLENDEKSTTNTGNDDQAPVVNVVDPAVNQPIQGEGEYFEIKMYTI